MFPNRPEPFVRWAGGKRQLLPVLIPMVPDTFAQYHEPFVGGGAMFFELSALGKLGASPCHLADINPRLITCYKAIRDDVDVVLQHLETLGKDTSAEGFMKVRQEFNQGRESGQQESMFSAEPPAPARVAALLIYILRSCFNGLYRENRDGIFNVGYCKNPGQFSIRADELRAASLALQGVNLQRARFERCLENTGTGDFVFFDPPYLGTFEAYNAGGFGSSAHARLASICKELDRGRVKWMLTNNDNAQVRKLWEGFNLHGSQERRAVNSDGEERDKVPCLIIRNY